jgi:predicted DNA-binding transcriptional regulator AlpA
MGKDTNGPDQPMLWGDEQPGIRPTAIRSRRPSSRTARTPTALPDRLPPAPTHHQELWDINVVATYLGVPKQTIYGWRTTGYGPQGFRVGKHLRWRSCTVIDWILRLEQDEEAVPRPTRRVTVGTASRPEWAR